MSTLDADAVRVRRLLKACSRFLSDGGGDRRRGVPELLRAEQQCAHVIELLRERRVARVAAAAEGDGGDGNGGEGGDGDEQEVEMERNAQMIRSEVASALRVAQAAAAEAEAEASAAAPAPAAAPAASAASSAGAGAEEGPAARATVRRRRPKPAAGGGVGGAAARGGADGSSAAAVREQRRRQEALTDALVDSAAALKRQQHDISEHAQRDKQVLDSTESLVERNRDALSSRVAEMWRFAYAPGLGLCAIMAMLATVALLFSLAFFAIRFGPSVVRD